MENPNDKVFLGESDLTTLADGRTITSGSDTFTGDEDTIYLTPEEIDNAPTQNSDNLVKSGGVYSALSGKQDTINSTHKLSADLVDDTSTTHKFVTSTDISNWNAKSDFSGSYNDLTDKPTIPTVNNNTITITQGGVSKGSFTLNQSVDTTIALDSGIEFNMTDVQITEVD